MMMLKYIFILFLLVLFSCKDKSDPVEADIEIDNLYNSWTNSWEEQTSGDSTKIFRPSNYKEFAISRYREVLIFNQNNTCSYLVLAPNDAHYFQNGRLTLVDQEKNIFAILDSTEQVYKKFQITELKKDLLKYILVN